MRSLLLLFAVALNSFAAGPMMFGVRGGMPFSFTESIASRLGSLPTTKRFEVGPTAGVRLPFGMSVEGDALYRRQSLNIGQLAGFNASTHSDSWEFPVMLKFTGGNRLISPVVGAGVTVRHINDFGNIPGYLFSGSTSSNSVGFVAGGGVRFQVGPVSVTPELRYSRWGGSSLSQSLPNLLPFSQNEASFLVGITF